MTDQPISKPGFRWMTFNRNSAETLTFHDCRPLRLIDLSKDSSKPSPMTGVFIASTFYGFCSF